MKKYRLIFIFSLLLFLSVALFIIKSVNSLIKADKEIAKISIVYEHLTSARLALRIAIINQRDYIITDETIYLNRYKEQENILYKEINSLRFQNNENNTLNPDSLDLLCNLIQGKMNQLDSIIDLKRNHHSQKEIEQV